MATRVICPCGVPVSLPESWHHNRHKPNTPMNDLNHDCIWHDSVSCKVCKTYEQISSYLDVVLACGEDEANQVWDEEIIQAMRARFERDAS